MHGDVTRNTCVAPGAFARDLLVIVSASCFQTETHYPDGRKEILFPDNTKKKIYPDGLQVGGNILCERCSANNLEG